MTIYDFCLRDRVMKKKVKRKNYPTKLKVVILKAKHSEYKALVKMAKRFSEGNLSAWLRTAGLKYIPKKSDDNFY